MADASISTPEETGKRLAKMPRWLRRLVVGENLFLTFIMVLLVVLPVGEAFFRLLNRWTGWDIRILTGTMPVVQHLVLVVGMLGGLIAARDGRLLSFSTVTSFLKGKKKDLALMVSSGISGGLTFLLGVAGWNFAMSQRGELAIQWGIPAWLVSPFTPYI
ncbi:TRAP transporter small permease [Verrucomicrobia bacterium]|nr:TRAP transporter small permease [Verrucomicrobiota bacterium]